LFKTSSIRKCKKSKIFNSSFGLFQKQLGGKEGEKTALDLAKSDNFNFDCFFSDDKTKAIVEFLTTTTQY
jgi:hypothetical protein